MEISHWILAQGNDSLSHSTFSVLAWCRLVSTVSMPCILLPIAIVLTHSANAFGLCLSLNFASDFVLPHVTNTSVYVNTDSLVLLTHWGRVTHICVGNLTIIGSDNGLSPGRRQAIAWINAGLLLIGPLGTNFNEILFGIQTFSFKKMLLKMSSAKWRPFCLGLNELMNDQTASCSYFFWLNIQSLVNAGFEGSWT